MPWSNFSAHESTSSEVQEFRWRNLEEGGSFTPISVDDVVLNKSNSLTLADDFKLHDGHYETLGLKKKQEELIRKTVDEMVQSRLEEVKQSAYEQAYAEGLVSGKAEAIRALREQWAETLEAFQSALQSITEEIHTLSTLHEAELVKLLVQLITLVLPNWSQRQPELLIPLVKEGVAALAESEHILVRLHPRVYEMLLQLEVFKDWPESLQNKIQWQTDENLALSTIQLKSEMGEIDNSLNVRLARLEIKINEILPKAS